MIIYTIKILHDNKEYIQIYHNDMEAKNVLKELWNKSYITIKILNEFVEQINKFINEYNDYSIPLKLYTKRENITMIIEGVTNDITDNSINALLAYNS